MTGYTFGVIYPDISYCKVCGKMSDDIWECCGQTMVMIEGSPEIIEQIEKHRKLYLRTSKLKRIERGSL